MFYVLAGFLWNYPQRVTELLQTVSVCLFPNLRKFQPLFLQILSQPCPISPLLLELWWQDYEIFCCSPTGLGGSVHFFQSIFFLLFWLGYFYCSILYLFDYFPSPLCSTTESIPSFFFFFVFFSSSISTCFFLCPFTLLTIYISLSRFSIFICFKCVCNCLLKNFYNGFFKILDYSKSSITNFFHQCEIFLIWYDHWVLIKI